MAIPKEFINDMIAKIDIVDLINSRVPLKKAGKNYSACCPFHNEKTPSFSVSQDKQFYHCFGCGVSGNVVSFIMEYDRLSYIDAITELANSLNIDIPEDKSSGTTKYKAKTDPNFYVIMEQINTFYQKQLTLSPDREMIDAYLKKRGLSAGTISKFGIGYAPNAWHALKQLMPTRVKELVALGMLTTKENTNNTYDRFRHRLMFPIKNRMGKIVGFGGRVFDDSKPKYLNSPETEIFHKGSELYGLYEVKHAHSKIAKILIVEGYMDVVSLAEHGIDYAVASLGTSTTSEQLLLTFRSTNDVICCYDGDVAGQEAAFRALETALPILKAGQQLRFMFLPETEDPDSMIRKIGITVFEEKIESSMGLIQFLFASLGEKHGTDKGALAKHGIEFLGKVKDQVLHAILLDELAYRLGMNNGAELISRFAVTLPTAQQAMTQKALKGRGTPLRLAIALLIQNPELGYQHAKEPALHLIKLDGVELLIKLLEITENKKLNSSQLLELFRHDKNWNVINKLLSFQHNVDMKNAKQEFNGALIWLNDLYLEQEYQRLSMLEVHTKEERIMLQKIIAAMKSK